MVIRIRAGRDLRSVRRARREVAALNLTGKAVRAELERQGGGGMYGDTSGFHERDMQAGWRASEQLPVGFSL